MQITKNPIATNAGPSDWFTGAVYVERAVRLDGVPDGYRAMDDREAIKVMVRP
jgi:hypothetical protein